MTKVSVVMLGALALAGCRSMAHSFERMEVEEREVISEETLSESWGGRTAVAMAAEPGPDGIEITAIATESGTRRVRFRERVRVEVRCARRAVGGIFEAPDSFFAVADDIWVATAFAGMFLFSHVESDDYRVTGVLFALSVGQIFVDAVTFIPWWIAGHDWNGPCDYVSGVRDEGERTQERDVPMERTVPLAGARVRVGPQGGPVAGEVACDAGGHARVSLADVVAWSRGKNGDLVLELADGERKDATRLSPGAVLNGPAGTRVDWRAARSSGAPDLAAATHLDGTTLVVTVENRGTGDAWQVAAIVASANAAADGRVAALGRVKAGERVEVRIALPAGARQGAIEFSEAFGRAPGAVPFGP